MKSAQISIKNKKFIFLFFIYLFNIVKNQPSSLSIVPVSDPNKEEGKDNHANKLHKILLPQILQNLYLEDHNINRLLINSSHIKPELSLIEIKEEKITDDTNRLIALYEDPNFSNKTNILKNNKTIYFTENSKKNNNLEKILKNSLEKKNTDDKPRLWEEILKEHLEIAIQKEQKLENLIKILDIIIQVFPFSEKFKTFYKTTLSKVLKKECFQNNPWIQTLKSTQLELFLATVFHPDKETDDINKKSINTILDIIKNNYIHNLCNKKNSRSWEYANERKYYEYLERIKNIINEYQNKENNSYTQLYKKIEEDEIDTVITILIFTLNDKIKNKKTKIKTDEFSLDFDENLDQFENQLKEFTEQLTEIQKYKIIIFNKLFESNLITENNFTTDIIAEIIEKNKTQHIVELSKNEIDEFKKNISEKTMKELLPDKTPKIIEIIKKKEFEFFNLYNINYINKVKQSITLELINELQKKKQKIITTIIAQKEIKTIGDVFNFCSTLNSHITRAKQEVYCIEQSLILFNKSLSDYTNDKIKIEENQGDWLNKHYSNCLKEVLENYKTQINNIDLEFIQNKRIWSFYKKDKQWDAFIKEEFLALIKYIEDNSLVFKETEKLNQEIEQLKNKITELTKQNNNLEKEEKNFQNILEELKKKQEVIEKELSKSQNENNLLNKEIQTLNQNIQNNHLEKEKEVKNLEEQLSEMKKNFNELQEKYEIKEKKIEKLNSEILSLREEINKKNINIEKLTENIKRLENEIRTEVNSHNNKLQEQKEKFQNMHENNLKNDTNKLENKIKKLSEEAQKERRDLETLLHQSIKINRLLKFITLIYSLYLIYDKKDTIKDFMELYYFRLFSKESN